MKDFEMTLNVLVSGMSGELTLLSFDFNLVFNFDLVFNSFIGN